MKSFKTLWWTEFGARMSDEEIYHTVENRIRELKGYIVKCAEQIESLEFWGEEFMTQAKVAKITYESVKAVKQRVDKYGVRVEGTRVYCKEYIESLRLTQEQLAERIEALEGNYD